MFVLVVPRTVRRRRAVILNTEETSTLHGASRHSTGGENDSVADMSGVSEPEANAADNTKQRRGSTQVSEHTFIATFDLYQAFFFFS